MHSTTLVLFDIDGTLIQSGRAGVRGMNRAFDKLYGQPRALDGVPVAGRCDRVIVMDAMRGFGLDPSDEEIMRLRDAYFEALTEEIGRKVEAPSGVLPGVLDLIAALEARDDVVVALLTGNFAGGARIKLGHFGLWPRFRFGAFGDDHLDRRELMPVALTLARAEGFALDDHQRVVIIGDTPLDVDCAHAHGARALAVATGMYDEAALRATGAELVVRTLDPIDGVLSWL
jgi:phosphoglycolate phosphatase-like HAD superfamily hydrolase